MEQKKRALILAVVLAAILAGALVYTRTARVSAPPAPTAPTPTPAVSDAPVVPEMPAPETAPASQTAPLLEADEAPATLTALRYMPEQAQAALAIPAVTSLQEHVVPFAQILLEGEMDVQHELKLIARDLAKDMDVAESDDLAEVLAAMGLDSEKGVALFLDLEALTLEALEMAGNSMTNALPDMSAAKGALVIPVNDRDRAEASLKQLTGDMLAGVDTHEELVGDIPLTVYDGLGAYFITDTVLAAGNDLDLLKGVAAREGAPAPLRYGSAASPAQDVHEAVMLIFGEKFIPVLEDAATLLGDAQPMAQMLVAAQVDRLKAIYDGAVGNEPVLVTLSVRDDAVELQSRIDTTMFPEAKRIVGEARPLRWAQLLPENTLAFLSLCFNEEAKQQLTDVYLESLPDDIRLQPGVSQGLTYASTVLEMLGREITLGMSGLDPMDFPSLILMVELANPVAAQMLLQMAPQQPHGDPYRDIQIKALAFPSPLPVYFALVAEALVLSNSDTAIQGVIDLVKNEETSGLFAALQPPIDPETPIFQALVLKPSLYTDIVEPLSTLAGRNLPREASIVSNTLSTLFTDIRFFGEMQDSWIVNRIAVTRK